MDETYQEGMNEADACEWGFVRVLLNDPSDKTARGAFADWLDEHDRGVQARYLRQIRGHKFIRAVEKRGSVAMLGPQHGRPTIPQVVARFANYRVNSEAWGALHVILDDNNIGDDSCLWAERHAREVNDDEGYWLAWLLYEMTKTQRGKIDRIVDWFLRESPWVVGSYYNPSDLTAENVARRVERYSSHVARFYRHERMRNSTRHRLES